MAEGGTVRGVPVRGVPVRGDGTCEARITQRACVSEVLSFRKATGDAP